MSKKRAELSKGEMVVAGAIWRLESATLGEIHNEVCQSEKMEYATVQSYIRRLEAKGYIKSKRVGRNNVYRPRVKVDTVIDQTLNRMVHQLFDGDTLPLFRHLIKRRSMTDEELAELKQLIDEVEEESHND